VTVVLRLIHPFLFFFFGRAVSQQYHNSEKEREGGTVTVIFFVFCLTDVFFAWHPLERASAKHHTRFSRDVTHNIYYIYLYMYPYLYKYTDTFTHTHKTYMLKNTEEEHRFFFDVVWLALRFLFLSRQSSLSKSPRRPFFGEQFFSRLADRDYRGDESFGGIFSSFFFSQEIARAATLVADGVARGRKKVAGK